MESSTNKVEPIDKPTSDSDLFLCDPNPIPAPLNFKESVKTRQVPFSVSLTSTIWTDTRPPLTKSLLDLEDYFKILERTLEHPTVKPNFRYRTYYKNSAAFGITNLRPYDTLNSAAALRAAVRPKMEVDRSIPSTSARIENALEAEAEECFHITKNSLLNTCTQGCKGIFQYLKEVETKLNLCILRAKKIKKAENWKEHEFGLGQLGGFCKQIHAISSNTLPGTKIFTLIASSGFLAILRLFRDTKAMKTLLSQTMIVDCPTEEAVATARIKIQAAYDSLMEAYQRVGRPGFSGNWTDFRHCDPEVITSNEMESILVVLMIFYSNLSTVTADLVEVFRTFIFSDNVQKTYLLKHWRSFPKDDQQKVVENIEDLEQRILNIHLLLVDVHGIAGQGVRLFCPIGLTRSRIPPMVRHPWRQNSFSQMSNWSGSVDTFFNMVPNAAPVRHQTSEECMSVASFDPDAGDILINPKDNLPCISVPKPRNFKQNAPSLKLEDLVHLSPLFFQFMPKSTPDFGY